MGREETLDNTGNMSGLLRGIETTRTRFQIQPPALVCAYIEEVKESEK